MHKPHKPCPDFEGKISRGRSQGEVETQGGAVRPDARPDGLTMVFLGENGWFLGKP